MKHLRYKSLTNIEKMKKNGPDNNTNLKTFYY